MFKPIFMCFSPYLGVGGGGLPRGLGHNVLMQFYSLGSSRMVVPLPSSRCLAEGNRISYFKCVRNFPTQFSGHCAKWGMRLRSRSCRNPLKVKNATLEAPGNSQNNHGTRWNLAVQRRNCPVVNNTILEGCKISRGIFRPLCEINPVRNFLARKLPVAKSSPPPCSYGEGFDGRDLGPPPRSQEITVGPRANFFCVPSLLGSGCVFFTMKF